MQEQTKEEREAFEEFENWRNEQLERSSDACTQIDTSNNEEEAYTSIIRKIPKCLVHFTRKMCKSNRDCIGESFYKTKIDYGCEAYDLDNLWFDTKYIDCSFLNKMVHEGKFMPFATYNKLLKTFSNVNNGLVKLCDTNEDFEKLLCEAYDLRDGCKNQPECMELYLQKVPKKFCKNRDYLWGIEEIENILGIKIRTNKIEIKEVQNDPECVSVTYSDGIDQILEFDKNNIYNKIVKRDVSDINLPDMNNILEHYRSIDSEFININPSSCQEFTFYSMMSLSLISTLLFFMLAFLGCRDTNKDNKLIIPSIVMTLSLLFISIYSTLSIE